MDKRMKRILAAVVAFFAMIFGIFAATYSPPAPTPPAAVAAAAPPAAAPPAAAPPAAAPPAAVAPAAVAPAAVAPAAVAPATPDSALLTCIDIAKAIASGKPVSDILGLLIDPSCGMTLQGAVDAIIAAGGDKQATQDAALLLNPAAGPGTPGGPKTSISTTIGGGGGASPF